MFQIYVPFVLDGPCSFFAFNSKLLDTEVEPCFRHPVDIDGW